MRRAEKAQSGARAPRQKSGTATRFPGEYGAVTESPKSPARPLEAPAELYARRRAEALESLKSWDARARAIGLLRFLAFLLCIGAATAAYDRFVPGVPASVMWLASVLFFVGFVLLVLRHDTVLQEKARAAERAEVNRRGLTRLDGTWTSEPLPRRGEITKPAAGKPEDPLVVTPPVYGRDLDLGFDLGTDGAGRGSLLHLCDTTTTRFGAAALRRLLKKAERPDSADETLRRQAAVRELVDQVELRQALEVSGRLLADEQGRQPDPASFLRWAEGSSLLARPLRFALILPLITVPLLIVQQLLPGGAHPLIGSVLTGLVALHVLVFALSGGRINKLVNILGAREHLVLAYAEMLRLGATAELSSPESQRLKQRLHGSDGERPAHVELAALGDLSSALNLRRHPILWFPVNLLTMWDLFFALRVEAWQARSGPRVRDWFAALGDLEAYAALATLGADNPGWAWPEIADGPARLEAEGLAHPLLKADQRVGNDVALPGPGRAWLLTGSNMSGKSTLLRSLGLMTVMGLAGGPVCSRRARLAPMRLSTVVRVDDSVLDGVSRFYAELLRLKETLALGEAATHDGGPPLFFLLDEILHGTNTRERELGAKLVVKTLCQRGAMGAVSTHDLGLAALAEETHGAVENVHFTEALVGDRMAFDYQLRPGPVRTTNALRLMRRLGLRVEWDLEPIASEGPEPQGPPGRHDQKDPSAAPSQ